MSSQSPHSGVPADPNYPDGVPIVPGNDPEAVAQAAETIDPQRNGEMVWAYKDALLAITREEYDALAQGRDFYAERSRELADALEFLLKRAADWNEQGVTPSAPFDSFPAVRQARAALRKAGRS